MLDLQTTPSFWKLIPNYQSGKPRILIFFAVLSKNMDQVGLGSHNFCQESTLFFSFLGPKIHAKTNFMVL